jgi:hypothetical protein
MVRPQQLYSPRFESRIESYPEKSKQHPEELNSWIFSHNKGGKRKVI